MRWAIDLHSIIFIYLILFTFFPCSFYFKPLIKCCYLSCPKMRYISLHNSFFSTELYKLSNTCTNSTRTTVLEQCWTDDEYTISRQYYTQFDDVSIWTQKGTAQKFIAIHIHSHTQTSFSYSNSHKNAEFSCHHVKIREF